MQDTPIPPQFLALGGLALTLAEIIEVGERQRLSTMPGKSPLS